MGKMVSVYLTDREADELRRFCEDHGCTQYSALKTALRELLSKPLKAREQEVSDDKSKTSQQANTDETDETETKSDAKKSTKDLLAKLLSYPE